MTYPFLAVVGTVKNLSGSWDSRKCPQDEDVREKRFADLQADKHGKDRKQLLQRMLTGALRNQVLRESLHPNLSISV
jgi:hypothetical protein